MPYQALGFDPTQVVAATGIPEFPLGTIAEDQNGNRFIYGRANGAIVAKFPCAMDVNFDFVDGAGVLADAISLVALADNEFGWFQISGVCTGVNVAAGTAAGNILGYLADGNGDLVIIAAAYAATGASNPRAKALTAIAANVSTVLLFNWL